MTTHSQLLEHLRRRVDIVADHGFRDRDPAGHLEAIRRAAGELDCAIAGLPPDTDPMLRHYLERQSFLKAIDWLESAPSGN